jgi:hypothetical protein
METRTQGGALMAALCLFIGTVLVIQLWLLSAAVDALLGGDDAVLWPAALASLFLLLLNIGLLLFALSYDRRLARASRG